jgi:hypothetical protein
MNGHRATTSETIEVAGNPMFFPQMFDSLIFGGFFHVNMFEHLQNGETFDSQKPRFFMVFPINGIDFFWMGKLSPQPICHGASETGGLQVGTAFSNGGARGTWCCPTEIPMKQ